MRRAHIEKIDMFERTLWPAVVCICLCVTAALAETERPDIGCDILFLGEMTETEGEAGRIDLQEATLRLRSEVDDDWIAEVEFVWRDEFTTTGTEESAADGSSYVTDIDVACLRNRSLPAGLGLSVGKFRLPFGRQAELRPAQYPFVRAPYAVRAFFGERGPTDVGAALDMSASVLPWCNRLTLYVVDGRGAIFEDANRDLAYGARWLHTWEVSDQAILELGGSCLTGPAADGSGYRRTTRKGFDVAYAYAETPGGEPVATVAFELIVPDLEDRSRDDIGYYAEARSKLGSRFWAGVCLGHVEASSRGAFSADELLDDFFDEDIFVRTRDGDEFKTNLIYKPGESSALRAEVSYLEAAGYEPLVSIQWISSFGS